MLPESLLVEKGHLILFTKYCTSGNRRGFSRFPPREEEKEEPRRKEQSAPLVDDF